MNIHQHMRESIELAQTYAEDGAFHTAAAILARLAIEVKGHAINTGIRGDANRRQVAPWEAHMGDDYAVVMLPTETTDTASIHVSSDDADLPSKIAALLNALGNR